MFPQYGELQPTNAWDRFVSLGHPRKFRRVLRLAFVRPTAAMSLNGGQPNFARCLVVSWAHYMYIFVALATWRNFAKCKIHFTSKPCLFLYWQRYCPRHSSSRRQPNFAAWCKEWNYWTFACRGRHLYSAGRPSRWASAQILVAAEQNWSPTSFAEP